MSKRKRKKRKKFLLSAALLFFFIGSFLFLIEKMLVPALKEISHIQCKAIANQIIDDAVEKGMAELDLSALLLENGESWTANTALVNSFCVYLSSAITKEVSLLPKENIQIPLGAVLQSSLFADMGPEIPFTLLPMGAAKVDVETDFSSVGINQINYKIWLDISIELKIVNPLYQEAVTMERKIMLADLIFGGKVPEHFFQMSAPHEYLLTE